jgi:hypothetical protein
MLGRLLAGERDKVVTDSVRTLTISPPFRLYFDLSKRARRQEQEQFHFRGKSLVDIHPIVGPTHQIARFGRTEQGREFLKHRPDPPPCKDRHADRSRKRNRTSMTLGSISWSRC